MEIILARHGETEWNVGEVFRGRADIELNDTGKKQAGLLAGYLQDTKIEAIYASPLKRALNTAETVARLHNLPVNVMDELNDLDFGEWEGLQVEQVRDRYAQDFKVWATHPERTRLPGGETLSEVKRRALNAVNKAVEKHAGTVVMVTHRVVIKVLALALLGLDESHFWNIVVDTCGVTTFRYEKSRFILLRYNDNSFLRPLKNAPLRDF
jgi:phosphoserine phosphatase